MSYIFSDLLKSAEFLIFAPLLISVGLASLAMIVSIYRNESAN